MIYKPMKRFLYVLSAAALLFAGCCDKKVESPRNVILIVGDGMGVAQVYASVVAEKGGFTDSGISQRAGFHYCNASFW